METKSRNLAIATVCVAKATTFTLDRLIRFDEEEFALKATENGYLIRFHRFSVGLYKKDNTYYFKSDEGVVVKDEPIAKDMAKAANTLFNQVIIVLARQKGGGQ